ncbi:MAG TPA: ribonuclease Y [Verrucomicrobiota bacterium]|nr:ribonuclease Y [Verrucomicrobiota bacterium]HNT13491.1 ribonuclease Y [Verrucomicrobiota bacterium]
MLACGAAGAAVGATLLKSRHRQHLTQHQLESARALETERAAARQELARIQAQTDQAAAAQRQELDQREKYLAEREALLNTQLNRLLQSEEQTRQQREALERKHAELEQQHLELHRLTEQRRQQLEKLSGVSGEAARAQFLKEVEQESLADAANISRHILEDARARAEEKARKIIITAIQRYAGNQAIACSSATIILQNSEIKGRIIGREGRNIRAFENATGVTVLIDDEAGAVTLSAFDPVRREIAREAMLRLIQDGRIHPTRIEEAVQEVKSEMEETIIRKGEEAAARAGVTLLDPELIKHLGKLFFRQSFAQNQLDHSIEVSQLAGLMAAELGLDAQIARRGGLLHDIGKALTHEVEGPHATVGADLVRRHGESSIIVNCVASHHNDVPPEGPWGLLVSAADAISASRPGARSESLTTYLKRIEELEHIGMGFTGVEKCFAVQAGRELRVFVQPQNISDEQAFSLARRIAGKIESELQYPGQIRVTVIREVRCIEVAK